MWSDNKTSFEDVKNPVKERHDRMNHSFSLNELSHDNLMREIVMTTMYDNKLDEKVAKWRNDSKVYIPTVSQIRSMFLLPWGIPLFLADMANNTQARRVPQVWGVLLKFPDMKNLKDIQKSVFEIRERNPSAIIAMDFEGWYVRAPIISQEDLVKFDFPRNILLLGKKEKKENNNNTALGQFPSAEYIGKTYKWLKNSVDKREFKKMMEEYGEAIGKLFSSYGINMILWPSLDVTYDTIGTKEETSILAKNDRAFSDKPQEVSDLWNAFIKWTMKVQGFIAVPKHFAWAWFATTNTDKKPALNTGLQNWAILPFKDYVNLHEIDKKTPRQAQDTVWKSNEKKVIYQNKIDALNLELLNIATKISVYKREMERILHKKKNTNTKKSIKDLWEKIQRLEERRVLVTKEKRNESTQIEQISIKLNKLKIKINQHISKSPIIMMGNNDNTSDPGTPNSLSSKTISEVKNYLWKTELGKKGWLGDSWILITDDLNTGSIRDYVKNSSKPITHASKSALEAWNNMLLFWDSNVNEIVKWGEWFSDETLRDNVRRILDMKVVLGIYKKEGDRYTLNPKQYMSTRSLVEEDATNSRIWPWNDRAHEYKSEDGKIPPISIVNSMQNAVKNKWLSVCRIDPWKITELVCSIHPHIYDSYRAPNENSLKKQFIIVDKSEQILYTYDLETREFISSKAIAIGKGTKARNWLYDKQVSWDKKTPVGYYMVVQKKDPKRIKETIESELYNEYGGDDWWMLVLAWAWQPQIAIHGTKNETKWMVSSGCIRMDNANLKGMLDSVPLGSMVVITN